ncbi:MAG: hypothetical protein E7510_09420 [Ruminococcus sp.]|nr:hypothetical protein [Ruminococcus sp.]
MKKTALLFSSALLTALIAVFALMYSPNISGLIIAIISVIFTTIVFYFAVMAVIKRTNEINDEKIQEIKKFQSIYSDSLHESTNMLTQFIGELSKYQATQNESLLTAVNALETSVKEIITLYSKTSIEQSQTLLKKIEVVESNIIQCSVSSNKMYEETTSQLISNIQETAKCIERFNQDIKEQISTCSNKTTKENSDIINQLSTMVKAIETGNKNTECTSQNVHTVLIQIAKMADNFLQQLKVLSEKQIAENEKLETICDMLLSEIKNQDNNNSLLTEIKETVATDVTINSSFEKIIRKIERLIDEGKQSNSYISEATEDMENVLNQLKETLLINNESLKNTLERFIVEYGKISNMDAKLIEKVLAKK